MGIFKEIKKGNSTVFIAVLALLCTVFTIFYMAMTGNTNQEYNDVIFGWISGVSGNKSAEMFLIFFLCFFCIGAYTLYYYLIKWKNDNTESLSSEPDIPKIVLFAVGIITFYHSIIVFKFSLLLLLLFVFSLIQYKRDKENMINGIIFFFINIYFVCAVYRVYVFFGGTMSLHPYIAIILGFVMSLFPIMINNDKEKIISKVILTEQLILPGLLFIYISNKYMYRGEIIQINPPIQITVFILTLVGLFVSEAIYLVKKNWNKETSLNQILSIGTCLAIVGFNLFYPMGSVVTSDLHHSFENVIGFHQIFQMGQIPFKEYIPISGMYSVVHGAFFQLFGNGRLADYFNAENIFYLIAAAMSVFLLSFHVNRKALFLSSILFYICYPIWFSNRFVFILPMMLLLSLPKFMENKNLWLKVWLLVSLFYGLYYPVYGSAICLAFMPLGIFQFVTYVKSEKFKKDIKTIKFWVVWVLCFVPVILSLPLLIGTYKHIAAMASQSMLADGRIAFGQHSWSMLPYLYFPLKSIFIYVITFMVPTLFVTVAFVFALKLFNFKRGKQFNINNIKKGCLVLSLTIYPLIAFTYTFVLFEPRVVFGRNIGVLMAGIIVMIVYALNYADSKQLKIKIICFALFIPMLLSLWGFFRYEYGFLYDYEFSDRLHGYYKVSDSNMLIQNDSKYKIGTGFIYEKTYQHIKKSENFNKTKNYFSLPYFGDYYANNIKGLSTIEGATVMGYNATKETVDILMANNAVIAKSFAAENLVRNQKNKGYDRYHQSYRPAVNYYFYYWLLASGKYIYNPEREEFYPNNDENDSVTVKLANKKAEISNDDIDIGLHSSSWGLSMDSLSHIFYKPEIIFDIVQKNNYADIVLAEPMDGNASDFLYLEFFDMNKNYKYIPYNERTFSERKIDYLKEETHPLFKYFLKKYYNVGMQVKFEWFDDEGTTHNMYVSMGQGKLLIPLGVGNQWLLNNHSLLRISVLQDDKEVEIPEIKTIQFLKLREI